MEDIERTSYFGTLYEWTPFGTDDLLNKFSIFYSDTDNVPFVRYDQQKHVSRISESYPSLQNALTNTDVCPQDK